MIHHETFVPRQWKREYNGELDFMRYVFGTYSYPHEGEVMNGERRDFISMWGSKEYRDDPDAKMMDEPHVSEDGIIRWGCWVNPQLMDPFEIPEDLKSHWERAGYA